jgi:LAS superfamily LD-carboxypeptidase LdcB
MAVSSDFKNVLFGLNTSHLVEFEDVFSNKNQLNKESQSAFLKLQKAAKNEGFELQIASGFRSFERQLQIWNGKFSGHRAVLDDENNVINFDGLDDLQKVLKIMRFSALPGFSRHHWGTDFDYFDAKVLRRLGDDYQLKLIPDEYLNHGIFSGLYLWLQNNAHKYGFHFPYDCERNGISPEPWHLSYTPLTTKLMQILQSIEMTEVESLFDANELMGSAVVLNNFEMLSRTFIFNVNQELQ